MYNESKKEPGFDMFSVKTNQLGLILQFIILAKCKLNHKRSLLAYFSY